MNLTEALAEIARLKAQLAIATFEAQGHTVLDAIAQAAIRATADISPDSQDSDDAFERRLGTLAATIHTLTR